MIEMTKIPQPEIEAYRAGYQAGYENGKRDAMVKEICQNCERVFDAGRYSFICPECRKKMQSENAKRIDLGGLGRRARSAKIRGCLMDGKESGE